MRAAIAWLDRYRSTRRFLILGDMDQLGERSAQYHREVGAFLARHADERTTLVTLGEQAYHIAVGAREAGMDARSIVVTYLARDAVAYVRAHARAGDCVLVKGDVSARMERVVAALLANQDDVRHLARQEPGWESVRVAKPARPTWLDVDLDAIAHNVRTLKALVGPNVALMAVLKADGYGHGAVKVARTAINNGADWCGVASLSEALALRNAGIEAPILILGFTPGWHAREALLRDVSLTVYDLDVARAYARAAQELKRTARVHVEVDTGMSRLGVLPAAAPSFIRAVAALNAICVEGIFTHFSSADSDEGYTQLQLARFRDVLSAIGGLPTLRYVHAANSAGALAYPEARFNMVRIGLAMYGLNPFHPAPLRPAGLRLRPAMTWRTTIAQVKTLPAGTPVSYGGRFVCPRETTIAVIPVGYADGFRRAPCTFGEVLVRGQRAPIVGAVCMDQSMIDVSRIPNVRIGDEVVIIGQQGSEQISAEAVAARLGTISYEVISAILPRVPRVS
jgi:alanine racemase